MAKQKLKHELVKINFFTDEFKFYNIEVIALSYHDLQVTFHHGKLGNKGTRTVHRTADYKEAMKRAANKVYELKDADYMDLEDMKGWLNQNSKQDKKASKGTNVNSKSKKTLPCDECGSEIPEKIHKKINEWARGGGNWDKDVNMVCYQKVLCIDCQVEHDIYRKRL